MRHGWLTKVVKEMSESKHENSVNIFVADDAIARFGVGRNMAESMGYWAIACDIIEGNKQSIKPLGKYIFDKETGADPYLEEEATLWLIHWQLTKSPSPCSTWYFAFHQFARAEFDKEQLESAISNFVLENEGQGVNSTTLSKDIDCFINSYVERRNKKGEISEESLDCPLLELDLISETATKGVYQFNIGPRESLPDPIFYYCLMDYMSSKSHLNAVKPKSKLATTLSIENILFDAGSPGRAFKLDEESITERLLRIEEISEGVCKWIDTAGLRQVQFQALDIKSDTILDKYYKFRSNHLGRA